MGCAQSKTDDVTTSTEPEAESVADVNETEPVPIEQPEEQETAADKSDEPEAEADSCEDPTEELFKIKGHEIDETGVVFYVVEAIDGDMSFIKRFSEFKALVVELGSPKLLPALPGSGLCAKLRSKHNPSMIQERETQLAIVLNAIAKDAELAETEAFKNFVQ
uniref:PX domain-containing protein n=1 Tax=Hyaloperonospora arabidopsidis (strain Emoy2) TaxID=559515 RepID=M4BEY7_HYAAE